MTAPAVYRDTPAGWAGPAGEYDRWFDEPWGRYALAVEAATVLRAAGAIEGTRLLDAGCGTGRFGTALARRGSLVVGVDPDAGMLAMPVAVCPVDAPEAPARASPSQRRPSTSPSP